MILPSTRLLVKAAAAIREQNQVIDELHHEILAAELAHIRISRDLIEQFLVAIDNPENNDQYREHLWSSLRVYRDEIAVREEHVR